MYKIIFQFCLALIVSSPVFSQQKKLSNETPQQKETRMQWWTDARFGMFIHWGLYALPARHEWVKQYERMTNEQYQQYFEEFNPDHFEPEKWAKEAKKAGMKYAVLTTKHHEGFCLFDSKYTDYKATNTKAHRDLVREFVNAFRKEGLKVGFYYSLIDWHHPDFTIDRVHPQRATDDVTDKAAYYARLNKGKNWNNYRTYLHNQVRELLTNYGKIDIIWLDFSYPGEFGKGRDDWGSKELLAMVRKLQPGIIVNNRLDLNDYADGFDFETPEQVSPKVLEKYKGKPFETCQTFSGSWGYYRDETTWKNQRQLLDLLISSVANGGNLILNVGPTARGEFDYRARQALDSMGYWMYANNEAIYNCTYAPDDIRIPEGYKATYNPRTKKLYLFQFDSADNESIRMQNVNNKVKYVQLLNDYSELKFSNPENTNDIVIQLPKVRPPYEIPVIELFLK